ncbi:hypothetical protein [Bosea sp. NPDC055594]
MNARSAFRVLVTLAVAAACYPVKADEQVIRAMLTLVLRQYPSQPLPGNTVDGGMLVENRSKASSFVGYYASGPGLCLMRGHSIRQSQNGWAESGNLSFDFTKIKQVRWLSATDDPASAPSRPVEAPDVRTAAIDAEVPWLCHDVVHLVTAKPAFKSTCANTWTIPVPTPADRAAVAKAIELVRKSCVAAKH